MLYLLSFAPWIAFAVIPAWQWGALASLVIAIVLIVRDLRAGKAPGALLLPLVSAGFFAVVTVIAFAAPGSPLHHYVNAAASTVLALMAWGGLAFRQPFTLAIARGQAPEAVWNTRAFYRLNAEITAVWASAFTVAAVALAVLDVQNAARLVLAIVQIAAFVVPVVFTVRHVAAARRRMAQPAS